MNARANADKDGFTLRARPEAVLDVYFDEQRVFSVPTKSFTSHHRGFHASWPPVLNPHLRGCTQLVVKEHVTGDVLLDERVQFDESTERILVTDRDGRPLAVDKFGFLVRMFSGADESTANNLATVVAKLVEDVNAFGVPGFLAYGSLLGAVRNGHLIGHDTDIDTAYLSNYDHPADVARESFGLERFLVERGWTMQRMRVGLMRAVFNDLAGDVRHIDIFISVHDGTHFYLNPFVYAELPRSALVPLSTVIFEGVKIAAPADTDAVLTATYGPSYLVPDPSFSYHQPRWLQRKSQASFGNHRLRRKLWQLRLKRKWSNGHRPEVSAFAKEVAKVVDDQVAAGVTVVDVGCGMGSDALWFAENGHRVIGIDFADPPLRFLRRIAERGDLNAEFRRVSLCDLRASIAAGAQLAGEPEELVLYSRNLLDVLEPEGRMNFWLLARTALLRGGELHLRFRTQGKKADEQEPGFRALDPTAVEAEAVARGAAVLSRKDRPGATTMVLTWS